MAGTLLCRLVFFSMVSNRQAGIKQNRFGTIFLNRLRRRKMMNSVWSSTVSFPVRESLKSDISAHVCIIGAGMAGILTAYLLKEKGVHAIIIEANTTASGQTKNTTAKITSQHDIIYKKLTEDFGQDKARQYAEANQRAIEEYERIITETGIDCDFERISSFIYTLGDPQPVREESEAAKRLGLPAVYTGTLPLPLAVTGAVEFKRQAQFNPLKFIAPLAEQLEIYEKTMALKVSDGVIKTDKGKITANKIVITTHFPFINAPGDYFLRMHQSRSYVIALKNAQNVRGMYIDAGSDGYSFRNYGDLLLLGGAGHRTGENEEGGAYKKLRDFAAQKYPGATEAFHWSAQDCMPVDAVPYIGRFSESTPDMFVATGFKKWGMTTSMVSAMILSAMISGESEHAGIFDPSRFKLTKSYKVLLDEGKTVVKNLLNEKFSIPDEKMKDIPPGRGDVVEYNGEKVGVYKNKEGKVFIVSTKCPHLGCQLSWNPDELMWECPCHGSRFHYDGSLADNPAQNGIHTG